MHLFDYVKLVDNLNNPEYFELAPRLIRIFLFYLALAYNPLKRSQARQTFFGLSGMCCL